MEDRWSYHNLSLYKDKEELDDALQLGAVQRLAPSNSKFGPIGAEGIRGLRVAVHPADKDASAPRQRWQARARRLLTAARAERAMVGLAIVRTPASTE
jgi:hypothetical protein